MRDRAIFVCSLLLLFHVTWSARGQTYPSPYAVENRNEKVIHRLDPDAIVVVRTPDNLERAEMTLPLEIIILSQLPELPFGTIRLMKDLLSTTQPVHVRLESLPEPLRTRSGGTSNAPWRRPPSRDLSHESGGWLASPWAQTLEIFFVAGAMLLSFWTFLFLSAVQHKKTQESLHSWAESLNETVGAGMQYLGEAISKSGDVARAASSPFELAPTRFPSRLPPPEEDGSIVSYRALLRDCYWGEFDSYAAFLWSRLSGTQRDVLIKSEDLRDYFAFSRTLPMSDLSAHWETYYQAPLSISHLNNEDLTRWVREYPALLLRLPSLRKAGLLLPATERAQLFRQAASTPMPPLSEILHAPPSPKRKLPLTAQGTGSFRNVHVEEIECRPATSIERDVRPS